MQKHGWIVPSVVIMMLTFFLFELAFSVRRESVTWDEGDHLFAGYMSLHTHDFGYNPEHPPLAKMVAALPLLRLPLTLPADQGRPFKIEAYMGGRELLFRNAPRFSGQELMFRARLAMTIFPLMLAVLLFFAGREMFGTATGLLALELLVFEPNVLTHGALVTTDAAVSCMTVAIVWSLYRYAKKPSLQSLLPAGLAGGLALAAKHSGLVLLVCVAPLLLGELAWSLSAARKAGKPPELRKDLLRTVGGYLGIVLLSVAVLWASYGFRYSARPPGLALSPDLAHYVIGLRPIEANGIVLAGKMHVMPESWLYGLADVRQVANNMPTYLLGKVYAHGLWSYFPIDVLIKMTLGSLGLIALALLALARGWLPRSRAVWYLLFSAAFYFLIAMGSGLNIGVRHVLPCIPLLLLFAAAGAVALARCGKAWAVTVAALVVVHAVSSARAFPLYLPYANEVWGGSENTWRYLSDSNVDWGQQLPQVAAWVRTHGAERDCHFAYFVTPFLLPADYGIPCALLPTFDSSNMIDLDIPATTTGTILVSAGDINGFEWGTKVRNPYEALVGRKPDDIIDDGVLVFRGTFYLPDAAAIAPTQRAIRELSVRRPDLAIPELSKALEISPSNFDALFTMGQALTAAHQGEQAKAAWNAALDRVRDMEPSAQTLWRAKIADEERKPPVVTP